MVDNGKINFIKKDRHPSFLYATSYTEKNLFWKLYKKKKSKLTGGAKEKNNIESDNKKYIQLNHFSRLSIIKWILYLCIMLVRKNGAKSLKVGINLLSEVPIRDMKRQRKKNTRNIYVYEVLLKFLNCLILFECLFSMIVRPIATVSKVKWHRKN